MLFYGGVAVLAVLLVWALNGDSVPDITGLWTALSPKAMSTKAFGGPVAKGAVIVLALVHVESGDLNVVEGHVTEVGEAGSATYATVYIHKMLDSGTSKNKVPIPSIMRSVLANDLIQPQV